MRHDSIKCQKCNGTGFLSGSKVRGVAFRFSCVHCGGSGELVRETEEWSDRSLRMASIGSIQGPKNKPDPWSGRFNGEQR